MGRVALTSCARVLGGVVLSMVLTVTSASGDSLSQTVLINEISAAPSTRLLIFPSNGPPRLGTGMAWLETGFQDSAWLAGRAPFGFGRPGIETDVGSMVHRVTPSLYLRAAFEVSREQAESNLPLLLRIDYDDGFVAYLNGREIARANLGPTGLFIPARHPAFNRRPGLSPTIHVLPFASNVLHPGHNVLAIQVHNTWPTMDLDPWDSTLYLDASLRLDGTPAGELVGNRQSWKYFAGSIEPSGGLFDPALLDSDATNREFHDWIELHNRGDTTVNLDRWTLSDDPGDPAKWSFPPVHLPPGGFLLVFCSALDRRDPGSGFLHTNFKLDQEGEFLGLRDASGRVVHELGPRFPRQDAFHSFGIDPATGESVFFGEPTPGRPNASPVLSGRVQSVEFDPPGGFHSGTVSLRLRTPTISGRVRYTLDGTEPTEVHGLDFQSPIVLVTNSCVRARAFRDGWIASATATATYLIAQPAALRSLPALAITGDPRRVLYGPEGITAISGGAFLGVSPEEVWTATDPGDYNMFVISGPAVERPASLEWLAPSGLPSVQWNIGLRVAASVWSAPRMMSSHLQSSIWNDDLLGFRAKPSFNFVFRGDYGPSTLEFPLFPEPGGNRFESLRLRAGKNDSFNPFVRDEVVRRLFGQMGQATSRGLLANLFVNAEFKGYFNLVERLRGDFFRSRYGGVAEWDVRDATEVTEGDTTAWVRDATYLLERPLTDPERYQEASRRFDIDNIIDYALLNLYCATDDWPENNWVCARERSPAGIWRFHVWDAEKSFGFQTSKAVDFDTLGKDILAHRSTAGALGLVFSALHDSPEFRLAFADRTQRHLSGTGALTAANVRSQFDILLAELAPVLHHVRKEEVIRDFIEPWMAQRPPFILASLRAAGLWPTVAAPEIFLVDGASADGTLVEIRAPSAAPGAIVYFNVDGSDPRAVGGAVHGLPYDQPRRLRGPAVVKARVLAGQEWSPVAVASIPEPPAPTLTVSEIHYDPPAFDDLEGRRLEFVELLNWGTQSVSLAGISFIDGIQATMPADLVLSPGDRAVLASDPGAFGRRYPGVAVHAVFTGRLDNAGERLTLVDGHRRILFSARYENSAPWPTEAAGGGFSLVPSGAVMVSPDDPRYWRSSAFPGGSPGAEDRTTPRTEVILNEVLSRPFPGEEPWLEIHNPTTHTVPIGGWYLSDDAAQPKKARIPDGTRLGPGEYAVLHPSGWAPPSTNAPFGFAPQGGRWMIFQADTEGQLTGGGDLFEFPATPRGITVGRTTDPSGTVHVALLSTPTPGSTNAGPLIGPLVIHEFLFDPEPDDLAFVEILNVTQQSVDLSDPTNPLRTWKLAGVDFQFPRGVVLRPGEIIVVSEANPESFRTRYDVPPEVRVFGPWPGTLAKDGETLRLERPESAGPGQILQIPVDQVRYSSLPPWPPREGHRHDSLQRVDPATFGNTPSQWRASGSTPGRPNAFASDATAELVLTVGTVGDLARLGSPLGLGADLLSGDSAWQRVEFYGDGVKLGTTTQHPARLEWVPNKPGPIALQAVAQLTNGSVIRSPERLVRVLDQLISPATPESGEAWTVTEPWLVVQPVDTARHEGTPAQFAVRAAGEPLNYRWFRSNGEPVPGAHGPILTIPTTSPASLGGYFVTVSNALGSVASVVAVLSLLPSDSDADGMPDAWEIRYGLNPRNAEDADDDPDGDNRSNHDEYLLASDPVRAPWDPTVVISEILYRPASGDRREAFLELLNAGATPADLSGFRLSGAIQFELPSTVLAADGRIVVAANLPEFRRAHPDVTQVIGPWSGALDQLGPGVTLKDASGRVIDSVPYADQGDWARRRSGPLDHGSRGWEWFAEHAGNGHSLELQQPRLPNDCGQNWAPSLTPGGSPGVPNGTARKNLAPLIREVTHQPSIPTPNQPIQVTAIVTDEHPDTAQVKLYYRTHSRIPPTAFQSVPMFDDGKHGDGRAADGLYAAEMPAQDATQVVEYYVHAQDGSGEERSWPAAALNSSQVRVQEANANLQVENPTTPGRYPRIHWVMTETERLAFDAMDPSSGARINATFIIDDGVETAVRHQVGLSRHRPTNSRSTVQRLEVELPADQPWHGLRAFDLSSHDVAPRQILGSVLARQAGLVAVPSRPVSLWRNGTDVDTPGTYAMTESLDSYWHQRHWPRDAEISLYVAHAPTARLAYLGSDPELYSTAGYVRVSRGPSHDWADLIRLTEVLSQSSDESFAAEIETHLDAAAWIRFAAVHAILGQAVGPEDNFGLLRNQREPRFQLIACEWHRILGSPEGLAPEVSLFDGIQIPSLRRLLSHPKFAPSYFAELQRLLATLLSPARIGAVADQWLGGMVETSQLGDMKRYASRRAAEIEAQIPLRLSIHHDLGLPPPPSAAAMPSSNLLQTTRSTLALWGSANALRTRSVRINGTEARWSAWEASWSHATIALRPGINRLLVQTFDEAGTLVDEAFTDVWRDAGPPTAIASGTIAESQVWSAAKSPYRIAGTLTVPAGQTLGIDPGTTLFFAPGARLVVHGGLRAMGTPSAPIFFLGDPNPTSSWAGLRFVKSTSENQLSFVVLEDIADLAVGMDDAVLVAEGVEFRGNVRCLSFTNASLTVSKSQFPGRRDSPMIDGHGIRAGGHLIFRENRFGGTSKNAELIHLTGAQRPGPIAEILDNQFGPSDGDGIVLFGADAHVEGNHFRGFRGPPNVMTPTSAVSANSDSDLVAVRNIFVDGDRAITLSGSSRLTSAHNLYLSHLESAVHFANNGAARPLDEAGSTFAADIFWNNGASFGPTAPPPNQGSIRSVHHCLLPELEWTGSDNRHGDPHLAETSDRFRLLSDSPAIRGGPWGTDMGPDVPAGALIFNEASTPTASTFAALRVAGPGLTHYRYSVNGGPWQPAEVPIDSPLLLSNLTSGTYEVCVIGRNSAGSWQAPQAATCSRPWTVDTQRRQLRLHEVLASNGGAVEHHGGFPDLLELHNGGASAIDLSGMRLSDDLTKPDKFIFPSGTSIPANGFLVVVAGNPDLTPGLHIGFAFDAEGDAVFLHDAPNAGGHLIDAVHFGLQIPGKSLGRDREGAWTLCRPTLGQANQPIPLGDRSTLRITEWLAIGKAGSFVELYNPLDVPIDLGGAFLTDQPLGWPDRHVFPAHTFLPPKTFRAFHADGAPHLGADHLAFKLEYDPGTLALIDPLGTRIDVVTFDQQYPEISQGRKEPFDQGILSLPRPTPGGSNWFNTPPTVHLVTPVDGQVVALPGDLLLFAEATDPDDFVRFVEFYAGTQLIGTVTAPPFVLLWTNAPLAAHRLIARAVDGAGEAMDSAPATIEAIDTACTVTLGGNGKTIIQGEPLAIRATVIHPTYPIARIEFLADQVPIGTVTAPPYEQLWIPTEPGPVLIQCRAFLVGNVMVPPAIAPVRVLAKRIHSVTWVAADARWRFAPAPSLELTGWNQPGFDDMTWSQGRAQLGYGEGDEATPIPPARTATTYFRHAFSRPESPFNQAVMRLMQNDGALVYLNGSEIFRTNLTAGRIGPQTLATVKSTNKNAFVAHTLEVSNWLPGTNLLAVETHQAEPNAPDLSFALELISQFSVVEPWILTEPQSQTVAAPAPATFEVEAAGQPLTYQWHKVGAGPIIGQDRARLEFPFTSPADEGGYFVVLRNDLGAQTSRVVQLEARAVDGDGDGLPDYWEQRYGLNAKSPENAHADDDGDGLSALDEFGRQLNPLEWNGWVTVQATLEEGVVARLQFRFPVRPHLPAILESTLANDLGRWVVEVEPAPRTSPGIVEVEVPVSPVSLPRLFRIRYPTGSADPLASP
ncbi:MAG: lamin tail domain-containing protein [Verrucomicrobiales bacterium]|nr:lamin tail domain-containing protein [Verrucomicrobiales bacterium]